MRIGMIQLNSAAGEKDKLIERAFVRMEEAVSGGAEVIMLPELWTIGYNFHNFAARVTTISDGLLDRLGQFAAYHHVTLEAGTLPLRKDGVVKNTGLLFGPDGRIQAHYSKRHLFYGYLEAQLMQPGTHFMRTGVNGIPTGMAVCYEFYFPRMWRKMAKAGTTLVLAPASWPHVHFAQWDVLTRARAIENGLYIAACNMAGSYHGIVLGGHSRFIDPVGTIEAEAGLGEEIIYGEYDGKKYKDLGKHLAVIRLEKEIGGDGQ